MLALRSPIPAVPLCAGLTASRGAALKPPKTLKRLYIAMDNDKAGEVAAEQLTSIAFNQGIDVEMLRPSAKDWNDDLRNLPRRNHRAPRRHVSVPRRRCLPWPSPSGLIKPILIHQ